MSAFFWNPWEVVRLLRKARDAATPLADFDLIHAAVQVGVHNLEVLASGEDGGTRDERLQKTVERLSWAAEQLARHAAESDPEI